MATLEGEIAAALALGLMAVPVDEARAVEPGVLLVERDGEAVRVRMTVEAVAGARRALRVDPPTPIRCRSGRV